MAKIRSSWRKRFGTEPLRSFDSDTSESYSLFGTVIKIPSKRELPKVKHVQPTGNEVFVPAVNDLPLTTITTVRQDPLLTDNPDWKYKYSSQTLRDRERKRERTWMKSR